MEQVFKSMMTQTPQNTFGANSPFPFSMPPQAGPTAPSSFPFSGPMKSTSPKGATVDVSASDVAATGTLEATDVAETSKPSKKFGIDLSYPDFFLQLSLMWNELCMCQIVYKMLSLSLDAFIYIYVVLFLGTSCSTILVSKHTPPTCLNITTMGLTVLLLS